MTEMKSLTVYTAPRKHARGRHAGGAKPARTRPWSLMSLEEKRQMLADTARLNVVDYLDENGAFDVSQARRRIPGCSIREFIVEEVARLDREGNQTLKRKIRIRFVDKLRALHMDNVLAGQNPDASPKTPEEIAKLESHCEAVQRHMEVLVTENLKLHQTIDELRGCAGASRNDGATS